MDEIEVLSAIAQIIGDLGLAGMLLFAWRVEAKRFDNLLAVVLERMIGGEDELPS